MDNRISRIRRVFGIGVALIAVAAIALSLAPPSAHAASAGPSKAEALSFVKKYDKDGYYLLKTMDGRGSDIMAWWDNGVDVFDNIDTMVHEECHGYSFTSSFGVDSIYVGNKKSVRVADNGVFRSKKIAKSVPKRLRSSRFWTYVGRPSANLASDVHGAYGLLNEFMAYCWGFNSQVKLYAYAKSFKVSDDLWLAYVEGSSNIALAHAEFRYFIEHYLYYAKKHDKTAYRSVVGNKAFKTALKKVDAKFASLVKTYDNRLPKIVSMLRKAGYEVEFDGDGFMVGDDDSSSGTTLCLREHSRFASELGKSRYRAIEKAVGLKPVKKRSVNLDGGTSKLAAASSGSIG